MANKFSVEIQEDYWASGLLSLDEKQVSKKSVLSVTHNGYQWISIGNLTDEELEKIGKVCLNYLKEKNNKINKNEILGE